MCSRREAPRRRPARAPHNWNATGTTENRPSIGWYRKEFTLPRPPTKAQHFWKVRVARVYYRRNKPLLAR